MSCGNVLFWGWVSWVDFCGKGVHPLTPTHHRQVTDRPVPRYGECSDENHLRICGDLHHNYYCSRKWPNTCEFGWVFIGRMHVWCVRVVRPVSDVNEGIGAHYLIVRTFLCFSSYWLWMCGSISRIRLHGVLWLPVELVSTHEGSIYVVTRCYGWADVVSWLESIYLRASILIFGL